MNTPHTHTHTAQEGKDWVGFDHFIIADSKRRRLEGENKERLVIEPTETKHTLKQKRNNGCCEYEGCGAKENLEWHHRLSLYSKFPPQQTAVEGCV